MQNDSRSLWGVTWALLAVLALGGCSLLRNKSDFTVDDDAGVDASADASPDATADAAMDATADAGDSAVGCTEDTSCTALANAEPHCDVMSGECGLGPCAAGYDDCDGDASNGCEVAITSDGNCGACGVTCESATPFCDVVAAGASCTNDCRPGSDACGMDCVDFATNIAHCGGCDMACPVPTGALMASCTASVCDFDCNLGRANCDGAAATGCEVSTSDDPMNCGACDTVCPLGTNVASASCSASTCGIGTCGIGFADCDGNASNGCEVDLNAPATCGSCSNSCDTGISCVNALCDPYVAVSTHFTHACALRDSGAVDCWGANDGIQYGESIWPTPSETPFRVRWTPPAASAETDYLAKSVTVGMQHTCFVSADPASDGVLHCMGTNGALEGGRPPGALNAPPQPVLAAGAATLPEFVSVTAGGRHTCAIDVVGDLWCWGVRTSGQTGDTTTSYAAKTHFASQVVEVAVGSSATCARLIDGTVECFGANQHGQLGRGATSAGAFATPAPVVDVGGTGNLSGVTQLRAGTEAFCAIRGVANELVCWGWNLQGAINIDYAVRARPVVVASGVSSVVMFHLGLCFVDETTSQVRCRGREEESQFGAPPTDVRADGQRYPGLEGIVNMRGGRIGGCGFRDGEVMCWGYASYGTVPRASLIEETPAPIVDLAGLAITDFDQLTTSADGSCGVRAGMAYCWGSGGRSESGDGTNTASSAPKLVPGLDNVLQVGRGSTGVCAIRAAGLANELRCWSLDTEGAIGGIGNVSRPTLVPGVLDPVSIAMGRFHSCAVLRTGQVMCWGRNTSLQAGTTGASALPTIVQMGGTDISASAVVAGLDFSCAILTGSDVGKVACWGANSVGQLATGTTSAAQTPALTLVAAAVQIEAGPRGACALTTANEVLCWGEGSYGQFGQATAAASNPTPVTWPPVAGTTPTSVATGERSTCVTYADSSVRCAGANHFSQLGLPGAASLTPRVVPGLSATEVTNGGFGGLSNCAGDAGRWWCWGLNDYGKLGTDTNIHYAPTQVGR